MIRQCQIGREMAENQPLYKELFTLLKKRQDAELLHSQTLSGMAFRFREMIHEKLGFPAETFPRQETRSEGDSELITVNEPWVRLYEYVDEQMQLASEPILSTIRDDGSLSFAVGVSLSAELDSYPKFHFWAAYALSITGPAGAPVLETLSGKARKYKIINNDFSQTVDDFINDIKEALNPEIIFNAEKKAECIGFFCE